MKNLAIIPARGGSKRISKKNIRPFLGKPIIAYSIEAAIECALFDEVMVSTDSQEIAEVALKYGASVPQLRCKETATDCSSLSDVMLEVLTCYAQNGISFENICCLFATAPFIDSGMLQQAYQKLQSGHFSSIVSVQQYSFPIMRSLKVDKHGYLKMNWPKYAKTRSQDIPAAYHDAGQFYWAKIADYMTEKRFYTKRAGYILLDEMEAQDIDTPEDWRIAEIKYQIKSKS